MASAPSAGEKTGGVPVGGRSIVLYDTVPGGTRRAKKIAENIGMVMERW